MTKSDLPDLDDAPSDGAVIIKRALLAIGGGIVLIFLAGVIAGYTSVVIEHGGPGLVDAAVLSVMLLLTFAVAFAMWRYWPSSSHEPEAPRVKSARNILVISVIVSVALGLLLALSDGSAEDVLSNGPVSPLVAVISIAVWMIAIPALTWLWLQRVDEHETVAYRDGAFVAVHAYMFLAPAWWMATRAGWLPDQDPMSVLLFTSLVWLVVWFVKRYF